MNILFLEKLHIFKKKKISLSLPSPSDFIANIKYLFATHFEVHYQAYLIDISKKYDSVKFDCFDYFKVYTLIQKENDNFYISC